MTAAESARPGNTPEAKAAAESGWSASAPTVHRLHHHWSHPGFRVTVVLAVLTQVVQWTQLLVVGLAGVGDDRVSIPILVAGDLLAFGLGLAVVRRWDVDRTHRVRATILWAIAAVLLVTYDALVNPWLQRAEPLGGASVVIGWTCIAAVVLALGTTAWLELRGRRGPAMVLNVLLAMGWKAILIPSVWALAWTATSPLWLIVVYVLTAVVDVAAIVGIIALSGVIDHDRKSSVPRTHR